MPRQKEWNVLMEAFYFEFFVLPLGLLVFVLVVAVYYFARKEEIARKKTRKLIQSYFKEKAKEQEHVKRELINMQRLLENKSIDNDTYKRLKKVLVTMHEKRAETNDLIDYVKSKK